MKKAFLLPVLLVSLASCSKNRLNGSGDTVTETRDVSSFSRIEASGSEEVEVLWASERRVEVSGYRNLVDEYKTNVSGGTLRLRYDDDTWNVRNNNLRVRVYTPSLEELRASGSGDVTVMPNGALGLRKAECTGSGSVSISQPPVNKLTLQVTGSGEMQARDASAKYVDAETTGSGSIETTATEELDAEITGSGDIDYWGSPRVNTRVTGSGHVRGH
jgi:hypothetical protein